MSEETATTDYAEKARQVLELLPALRGWVTSRVLAAGDDRDISLRQYAALRGIQEGASSPGELARLWRVTPAVITGIVDRLERRGLVRREIDPQDRRRLRLGLTEAGCTASAEVEKALVDDLAAQLTLATPQELAELGRSLALLQRTFAALEAKAPAPPPLRGDEDHALWVDEDDGPDSLPEREERRGRGGALVGVRS